LSIKMAAFYCFVDQRDNVSFDFRSKGSKFVRKSMNIGCYFCTAKFLFEKLSVVCTTHCTRQLMLRFFRSIFSPLSTYTLIEA
jgi:hypothetical protein